MLQTSAETGPHRLQFGITGNTMLENSFRQCFPNCPDNKGLLGSLWQQKAPMWPHGAGIGAWAGRPSASLDTPGAGIPPGPGRRGPQYCPGSEQPRREATTRTKKRSERHLFPTGGWTVRLSSQAAQEFCSLRSWMEADLSQNLELALPSWPGPWSSSRTC